MEEKREQWGSRLGFVMAAIGSAIGLGNIWRFSYMTYSNGGGAFLIPYFVALFTAGIPIMILEFSFGHKMRGTAPAAFAKVKKKFEIFGWLPALASFGLLTYYVVILSWALSYVFYSFGLKWGEDTNAFFFGNYLQLSDGIWNIGGINTAVFISFILIWAINYFVTIRGIAEGIEKACKVFMPVLFILSVIIVIRGITLPGAIEGINWYLKPDFSKIWNPKVWIDAYGQIFFTLSVAFAVMIAYSSYLPKDSDLSNNGFITALANCGYSFFMGFGTFGILGYMAHTQNVPFEEVVSQSIGLAFVTIPKAINMLPGANTLFGVIFFVALVFAGLSSSISLIEAFASGIIEKYNMPRKKAINLVCGIAFIIGLIFVTKAGLYFLDIADHFLANYIITAAGIIECIVLGYIYGAHKLREHANAVSEVMLGSWWDFCIKVVTPVVLGISYILNIKADFTQSYGGYPWSANFIVGWGAVIATIIVGIMLSSSKWKKDIFVDVNKEVQG